ncbi:MAG: 4Fe-4S binding protein [Ruminococcus sp.]|nr:4Fe-4S binding protein [Ruminococcus sp.]
MSLMSMTKTNLKSLFRGPYTVKEFKSFENTRHNPTADLDVCVYCGICAKRCPTDAISVSRSDQTWKLSELKCIRCGYCTESCPKKCMSMKKA